MKSAQPKTVVDEIKSIFRTLKGYTLKQWIVLFIFGWILSVVLTLNWQPWLEMGKHVAEGIISVPMLSVFYNAPLGIGDFAQWLSMNLGQFIGLGLWAGCQFMQCIPLALMIEGEEVPQKIWTWYAITYILEVAVVMAHHSFYGDGLGDFLRDFFQWQSYKYSPSVTIDFLVSFASFEIIYGMAASLIQFFATKKTVRN